MVHALFATIEMSFVRDACQSLEVLLTPKLEMRRIITQDLELAKCDVIRRYATLMLKVVLRPFCRP
jgi:hypothetical protein